MGEININDKAFFFEDIELTYEQATIITPAIAKQNLIIFKKTLDKRRLPFFLMHGTLLGAIREHDFIKHDIDIDTCVTDEEALKEAIPDLSEAGLKLCRYQEHLLYSFIKDNVYIDVYIVNKLEGLIGLFYVRYLGNIIPKKFFIGSKNILFQGEKFRVPFYTMQLLKFWYGKDWRTPKENAPSNDRDQRGYFLEHERKYRFLFRPIKKIIKW